MTVRTLGLRVLPYVGVKPARAVLQIDGLDDLREWLWRLGIAIPSKRLHGRHATASIPGFHHQGKNRQRRNSSSGTLGVDQDITQDKYRVSTLQFFTAGEVLDESVGLASMLAAE